MAGCGLSLVGHARRVYAAAMASGTDAPLTQRWRTAMGYIEEDLASGYPKVWAELESLAWHKPELRTRLIAVSDSWRTLLGAALAEAIAEDGLGSRRFPAGAWGGGGVECSRG